MHLKYTCRVVILVIKIIQTDKVSTSNGKSLGANSTTTNTCKLKLQCKLKYKFRALLC